MIKEYNKSVQGKLFKYFKERLKTKQSTKGYERCDCIYCGGKYTYGINVSTWKTHCFKCEVEKTPIALLMDIEQFTEHREAYAFLKLQQEYTEFGGLAKYKKTEVKEVTLPDSFTPIGIQVGLLGRAAQRYMKGRGFNLIDLAARGVGYCTSGLYGGYIIFPFYVGGRLVFFQGRRYMELNTKMKNPAEEEFGIGKSKIIYNADALYIYDEVDVVESITNSLTLEENAVALLGKAASAYQISMILTSPCSKVNIILDPDAIKNSIDLALRIVNFKDEVRLVLLPEEKDVNDIGRSETNKIKKRSKVLKYMDLIRLKNAGKKEKSFPAHFSKPSSYSAHRGAN